MKFTEHLAAHITPEWRKQYIHYEVLDLHCSKLNYNEFMLNVFLRK